MKTSTSSNSPTEHAVWPLLFGFLAVANIILTRIPWLEIPMQTDTGMWAYIGARLLDGATLYTDLCDTKPPGIFYTFAAAEWISGGGSDRIFHFLDMAVTLAVSTISYIVARRFASRTSCAFAIFLLTFVMCHRILADWGCNTEKFVVLFEMTALWLVLKAHDRSQSWHWLLAGVTCGLAGAFKQTGCLFLICVIGWLVCSNAGRLKEALRPIGLLFVGVAIPWAFLVIWMVLAGNLTQFWSLAVMFDLTRVGSTEGTRLGAATHWTDVVGTMALAVIVFGPFVLWLLSCAHRRLGADKTMLPRGLGLLVAYGVITLVVFPVAPYGYGHYLLQAAPAATVIAACWFDKTRAPGPRRSPSLIATGLVLFYGAYNLADHLQFTFDRSYPFRQSYELIAAKHAGLVACIGEYSSDGQTVMVWPTDHAVSYYADRTTSLEFGHSLNIFRQKIEQVVPPLPEFLRRLEMDPPDVIVDYSTSPVFSFLAEPSPADERAEARALEPWKQWVRQNYGDAVITHSGAVLFHGRPWTPPRLETNPN